MIRKQLITTILAIILGASTGVALPFVTLASAQSIGQEAPISDSTTDNLGRALRLINRLDVYVQHTDESAPLPVPPAPVAISFSEIEGWRVPYGELIELRGQSASGTALRVQLFATPEDGIVAHTVLISSEQPGKYRVVYAAPADGDGTDSYWRELALRVSPTNSYNPDNSSLISASSGEDSKPAWAFADRFDDNGLISWWPLNGDADGAVATPWLPVAPNVSTFATTSATCGPYATIYLEDLSASATSDSSHFVETVGRYYKLKEWQDGTCILKRIGAQAEMYEQADDYYVRGAGEGQNEFLSWKFIDETDGNEELPWTSYSYWDRSGSGSIIDQSTSDTCSGSCYVQLTFDGSDTSWDAYITWWTSACRSQHDFHVSVSAFAFPSTPFPEDTQSFTFGANMC